MTEMTKAIKTICQRGIRFPLGPEPRREIERPRELRGWASGAGAAEETADDVWEIEVDTAAALGDVSLSRS